MTRYYIVSSTLTCKSCLGSLKCIWSTLPSYGPKPSPHLVVEAPGLVPDGLNDNTYG